MTAPGSAPGAWLTRFAPSPTGYLHLGHVAHALHVWGIAAENGAQVLLRIEDHDRGRCRPEYEQAILEDLQWLGFHWHGELTRQSDRIPLYERHLERLREAGLVYACDCSRKQILARTGHQDGAELRYDNHCRDRGLPLLSGMGWRLCLPGEMVTFNDERLGPQTQHPESQCGDLLLRDRHNNWTYQYCVVVDDWLQGVNLIVRGEDLLESTGRQLLLARLLGRDDVPRFHHHRLLYDASGTTKLSKRDQAHAVRQDRLAGMRPEDVLAVARAGERPAPA